VTESLTSVSEAPPPGPDDASSAMVDAPEVVQHVHRFAPGGSTVHVVTASETGAPESRLTLRRLAHTLTALGALAALLLAYEFLLSGIPQARTQAELLSAFKQEVPTTTLDSPSSAPAEGGPVALLAIPSIGLQQVVVEGTSPEDLKDGPGHLRAAPLPGEFGNAVIEGRRTTYGAPFGSLHQLHAGDIIKVTTGQGLVVYVVTTVTHVNVGQPDPASPTLDSRLTLLTSDPAYVSSGELAVTAKLQGEPLAVATRPPVLTGTGDLGLSGDPIGLGFGLIWLELLAAAAWLAWRLRTRLPGSILYMFAAPVMLAMALLAFSNLDSLFPGTM
jgi:sortase A